MDSFMAADPYADYELPELNCPYQAPPPPVPFESMMHDDEVEDAMGRLGDDGVRSMFFHVIRAPPKTH
jgi:hypothetical protein